MRGADHPEIPDGILKVVTWNIKHASRGLGRVASVLAPLNASIIALNEVDRWNPRSAFRRQAPWLGRALRRVAIFGPAKDCLYGNALLLTAVPLLRSLILLPGDGELRSCLWARLPGPERPLDVFATHLGLRASWRLLQIGAILDWMTRLKVGDCLLMGDFNAEPASPELGLLRSAGLLDIQGASGCSNQPTFAGRRLDSIWASPGLRPLGSKVIQTDASDHWPVVTWLKTKPPSRALSAVHSDLPPVRVT